VQVKGHIKQLYGLQEKENNLKVFEGNLSQQNDILRGKLVELTPLFEQVVGRKPVMESLQKDTEDVSDVAATRKSDRERLSTEVHSLSEKHMQAKTQHEQLRRDHESNKETCERKEKEKGSRITELVQQVLAADGEDASNKVRAWTHPHTRHGPTLTHADSEVDGARHMSSIARHMSSIAPPKTHHHHTYPSRIH
jgi:chromosome segregation ATPase